ncbi:TPA: hypothetical protein ACRGEO_003950, partial [Klebsiella pneumoniae]
VFHESSGLRDIVRNEITSLIKSGLKDEAEISFNLGAYDLPDSTIIHLIRECLDSANGKRI